METPGSLGGSLGNNLQLTPGILAVLQKNWGRASPSGGSKGNGEVNLVCARVGMQGAGNWKGEER